VWFIKRPFLSGETVKPRTPAREAVGAHPGRTPREEGWSRATAAQPPQARTLDAGANVWLLRL
jgi:hypothetical protein